MAGAVRIDGGGSHSLVLKNDGTVWASGYNVDGELGNGTNTNSNIYVQVNFLTGVKAIAAGGYHSLAVKNGYVWSWGGNGVGQLGIGTGAGSNIPVPVQCIKDIIAVSAGQYNSLALKNDGTVWIWGSGGGNIPVLVDSLSAITAISTGWWHSLSLKNDGTVWAWGENSDGQLGNGSYSSSYNPVPAPVNGLTDIIEIAAAEKYSLALKNDGTVWTWGSGITTPVLVNGLCLNVTAVNEIADENIFSIFPNPSTGKFTIQSSEKISSLTIKNELGQTIYSESKKDFAGEYNSTIDLSNQPKGVYFIDMLCGNERRTRKIILE
jgi:alpha-tubulin suppressor-like RCC1 family protein